MSKGREGEGETRKVRIWEMRLREVGEEWRGGQGKN